VTTLQVTGSLLYRPTLPYSAWSIANCSFHFLQFRT